MANHAMRWLTGTRGQNAKPIKNPPRRRIAVRLTSIFAGINVLLIVLIAAYTGFSQNRMLVEDKYRQFENVVMSMSRHYAQYYAKDITESELSNRMADLGANTDSRIILVNLYPDNMETGAIDELLDTETIREDLRTIASGTRVFRPSVHSASFANPMLFYGAVLYVIDDMRPAVVILGLRDSIDEASQKAWTGVLYWAIPAALIMSVLTYILSARLARPLVQMSRAAQALANGEEVPDIATNARDEVGQLAEAFNRMKRKLADNERMRRNFLVNVSHDMRTPLTTMIGLIKGIREGWVTEENAPQAMEVIESESQRLVQLTGDILDLARMQSGVTRLTVSQFDVRELLNEIAQALDPEHARVLVVEGEAFTMQGDRAQLMRAVYNLVQNAIKHGKGMVRIGGRALRHSVEITVEDEGPGIPSEQLSQLFDRFYRGDNARGGSGSGLGLNIAREIVRLHGGDINAQSGSKGTCFTIICPSIEGRHGA